MGVRYLVREIRRKVSRRWVSLWSRTKAAFQISSSFFSSQSRWHTSGGTLQSLSCLSDLWASLVTCGYQEFPDLENWMASYRGEPTLQLRFSQSHQIDDRSAGLFFLNQSLNNVCHKDGNC